MQLKSSLFLLWIIAGTSAPSAFSASQPAAVSVANRASVSGGGNSFGPAFSASGRFIVFVSHAKNLVTNDALAPYLDIFVRDLASSNTVLASVNTTGIGGGNADANFPSISSNGQFVAFASVASNLVQGDTNAASDVFVRDLVSGVTKLVSVDLTGTNSAGSLSGTTDYRLSSNPLISADARWVIFESLATNMIALQDTNQLTDIFARDLQTETTVLVSINSSGLGSGNGNSDSPSITPDGRRIAFVSTSTDLVPGATNNLGDIYVRDLDSRSTVWASSDVAAFFPSSSNYRCFNPAISADGRVVAFKANSPADLSTTLLIYYDSETGTSTALTSNTSRASWPAISADGRFIAAEDSNQVYVWDLQTGSHVLVSVNENNAGPANAAAHSPVMTPDGRFVAFLSAATDLAANATNGIAQVYLRDRVLGTTHLVTADLNGAASSGDMSLLVPAIANDGSAVAFESLDANLVANDLNQASDIFLRPSTGGATQLISRRHADLPAHTAVAISRLWDNSVSANGRFIAFTSPDSNLAADDSNGWQDIFVMDQATGMILPATADPSGVFSKQWRSRNPVLSGDGRFVAFIGQTNASGSSVGETFSAQIYRRDLQSGAIALVTDQQPAQIYLERNPNYPIAISSDGNLVCFQSDAGLVPTDYNNRRDVFLRDMSAGTNMLISVNRSGTGDFYGDSSNPFLSPDARWVLFASTVPDLTTNQTYGTNLFARDLLSNSTLLVSAGPGGLALGYNSGAVVSADSRWVAFASSNRSVFIFDLQTSASKLVCTNCATPSLSSDGRFIAYATPAQGTGPVQIMLLDRRTGISTLISRSRLENRGGDGNSSSPLLSWDGRFVVFASKASDLVENDTNGASDIFVRDNALGTTLLVSLNLQGTASANGPSSKPVLAADGRTILFQSFASTLVPGDYNDRRDVFQLRLGGPDTDADGMDDDWEMAYFGTLARDGTGDFDGDGQSDLQEFLAGTDPTNRGSVLRVLTLTSSGGGTRLIWAASPGKSYRVQFKDDLQDATWNDMPGSVIANGTTGSFLDSSAPSRTHRFYRVVLVP